MSLPTVTRSWQFAVNQSFAMSGLAQTRAILRALKNQLIGAGGLTWTDGSGATITPAGAWTVVGSSDSSTAGLDGVDRWAADSNLVWNAGGSAHSWIVLQQAGISTTFQMLIALDVSSGAGTSLSIVVSHNAFTGGSVTANPTATGSNTVIGATTYGVGTAGTLRLHVMRSADGQGTRIVFATGGIVTGLWIFDKMGQVTSGVGQPYAAWAVGSTDGVTPASTAANHSTTANCRGFGVSALSSFMTCEGWGAGPSYAQVGGPSNFTAASPMLPIQLWSTTASNRGRVGTLVDAWFGLSTNPTGTAYPDTGTTRQFVQHGVFITPWNRTTPAMA